MRLTSFSLLIAALSGGLVLGCNDDNARAVDPHATRWVGIFQANNSTDFGGLAASAKTGTPAAPAGVRGFPLSSAVSVEASAVLDIIGPAPSTLTLTGGSYDPATNEFDLTDQGYTLTGSYDGSSRLEGTFAGPGPIGVFVTLQDDGNGRAFCGTYTGAAESGVLGFAVVNGVLAGNSYAAGSFTPTAVDGTVSGTTIAFDAGSRSGTGTISGANASGDIDAGGGVTLTWTAGECTP